MVDNTRLYSCFFPTKTIFIDDNKEFLDGLSLNFFSELQSFQYFTNTKEALKTINDEENEFFWYKDYLNNLEEEELEKKIVEFNISDIYRQIYNRNRFNVVTTVVVDYDMPEMDGITFCQKINNPNVFKVMLTGAADNNLAVEAFNKNIIQAFIPKQNDNVYEALDEFIKKGADLYFNKISDVIFMSLEQEKYSAFKSDPEFIAFFRKILKEKKISEFYLSEGTGSYVLVDVDGKIDVLYMLPEEHANQLYEGAQGSKFSAKELSYLKNKEKIICSTALRSKKNNQDTAVTSSLASAKPFMMGKEKYYYAYRHNVPIGSSIITFKQFLQQQ